MKSFLSTLFLTAAAASGNVFEQLDGSVIYASRVCLINSVDAALDFFLLDNHKASKSMYTGSFPPGSMACLPIESAFETGIPEDTIGTYVNVAGGSPIRIDSLIKYDPYSAVRFECSGTA